LLCSPHTFSCIVTHDTGNISVDQTVWNNFKKNCCCVRNYCALSVVASFMQRLHTGKGQQYWCITGGSTPLVLGVRFYFCQQQQQQNMKHNSKNCCCVRIGSVHSYKGLSVNPLRKHVHMKDMKRTKKLN
jgi:hypothetical protein